MARGTDTEGHIGAGQTIRGDAKGFLIALGGLAACGKPPKTKVRLSIGRLTEAALNTYGEKIQCTKGVTLVERFRVLVAVATPSSKGSGNTKQKAVWRSFKTVLASIKTRLGEWTMAPQKDQAFAIHAAQQRFIEKLSIGSAAHMSLLAVRTFWSNMWDGLVPEPLPPEPWKLALARQLASL